MAGHCCELLLFAQLENGFGSTADAFSNWHAVWEGTVAELITLKARLDPFIWLIGSVLALVPGSFAIYKWWFYRESRMPLRLVELLKRDDDRLDGARGALLSVIARPRSTLLDFESPIFVEHSLAATMRRLKWTSWLRPNSLSVSNEELEGALHEIEQQKKFCADRTHHYLKQEGLIHLLKGAHSAALASNFSPESQEFSDANKDALFHFNRALEIDDGDIDALEYAAHQHRILNDFDLALAGYERLEKRAAKAGSDRALTKSRALRYQGEVLEKQYDLKQARSKLDAAKAQLEAALTNLPDLERGKADHAAIYEILGRIEEKRGRTMLPGENYGAALSIYESILRRSPNDGDAKEGSERMKAALVRFHAVDVGANMPMLLS
ncbi:hypothetical protein [Hyphomicrobium sp. 2TAF46]|uniref:hypothetical protein n=1 Tax=Hyphomicrobium sp. 2TAF46 TaxID=3233019 RepID=UPI003F93E1F3